jgi:hypothetical protein
MRWPVHSPAVRRALPVYQPRAEQRHHVVLSPRAHACPDTGGRRQWLGSCNVAVARVEWKQLFAFPVAASPCYGVRFVDLHLPHASPLVSGFDLFSLSIAVDRLCVVTASGHLGFRAAGVARYLLAVKCPAQ